MTFQEQFEKFAKKLAKVDNSSLPQDLAMQVTMTDEDCGGTFYIANIGGNYAVEPYDYKDHTVAVSASAKVLNDIFTKKIDAADALFSNLISVEGSTDHCLAILNAANAKKPAAKKAAKKPAAKKPAAKKAAAKKPAAKKPAAKKAAAPKAAAEKKVAEKKAAAPKKAAEKKAAAPKKAAEKKAAAPKKAAEKKAAAPKAAAKKPAAKK